MPSRRSGQALDLGATQVEYYYLLGLAYVFLDRCDEARPWLEEALKIEPNALPAQEGLDLCREGLMAPDEVV